MLVAGVDMVRVTSKTGAMLPAIRVFVSHAHADKEYADAFVDNVLIRGAGLRPEQVFYSSEADTGVSSGQTLLQAVRSEAGQATLIIALVTPWFQTRPVCIAELGAAWARDVLMPLMAPSMKRDELEGVLDGMVMRAADDRGAIDEIAGRLDTAGAALNTRSWNVGVEKWLSFLRVNPAIVKTPSIPTLKEIDSMRVDLDAARSALDDAGIDYSKLEERYNALKVAKTLEEIQTAVLPVDESERFGTLLDAARSALKELSPVLSDALWYQLAGVDLVLPSRYDDATRHDKLIEQTHVGTLSLDDDSDVLSLDPGFPDVVAASDAVELLRDFLQLDSVSEDFHLWFLKTHRVPMDLTKKACWDALFD
jgi:hypothetical protein